MNRINRRAARLFKERSGVAIVEFALLIPVLLTLFIGSFETANLLLAYMKLEVAAETAADLVSKTTNTAYPSLAASDFTNFTNAADEVMTPLPTSGLQIAYASVTYNNGSPSNPVIDWHTEVNGAAPITLTNLPNNVAATTMMSASTDSFVVVRLTYPYVSPVSHVLATNWTLTEAAFNRPRYVNCVATYMVGAVGNTANQCP